VSERELLVDCLTRLNRARIAYFVTGSMASNYWGIPRTTHDLDFVIQLPSDAIATLVEEFRNDFYLDLESVRAAYQPPFQFNAIDLRSSLKVDFWMLKSDEFDRVMFERRRAVQLFLVPAWIATAEDVILHKLFWNRITPSDRQINDAAGVISVQGDSLDRPYIRDWALRLGVIEVAEALLRGEIRPKHT
jgi:hypothetical protein